MNIFLHAPLNCGEKNFRRQGDRPSLTERLTVKNNVNAYSMAMNEWKNIIMLYKTLIHVFVCKVGRKTMASHRGKIDTQISWPWKHFFASKIVLRVIVCCLRGVGSMSSSRRIPRFIVPFSSGHRWLFFVASLWAYVVVTSFLCLRVVGSSFRRLPYILGQVLDVWGYILYWCEVYYFIYTSHHFTPHGKYELNKLTSLPNVWLLSSVGRATHRQRGGHGFESRWSLDFFQASSFQLEIYCDDHSSFSYIVLLLCYLVTFLLCYLIALSPCYSVSFLPCYPLPLFPCYSVVNFFNFSVFVPYRRSFFGRGWVRSWLSGLHYKSVFVESNY